MDTKSGEYFLYSKRTITRTYLNLLNVKLLNIISVDFVFEIPD